MSNKGTYGDPNLIFKLGNYRMPFGKHSNVLIIDLPMTYLDWYFKKGFPQSELGELMRIVHETKLGEMEHFLDGVRKKHPNPAPGTFKKK